MKIEIKKVLKPLWLREYAEAYGETKLLVWVNPPKAMLETRQELIERANRLKMEIQSALKLSEGEAPGVMREAVQQVAGELAEVGRAMSEWLATIWSQGDPETQVSVNDLQAFILECDEKDPALYTWLLGRTLEMIVEHRNQQKKS